MTREELILLSECMKKAVPTLRSADKRTQALAAMAEALVKDAAYILEENKKDLAAAEKNGVKKAMIDRLTLTKERILAIADAVKAVNGLRDPLGVRSTYRHQNGMTIEKHAVPLGVIAMIYEARPNVTADAAALAVKSGNAVLLRGGKEAYHTNACMVKVLRAALASVGVDENAVSLLHDLSHETVDVLLSLRGHIDLVIPRGGKNLIRSVVEKAAVPVIETGAGNCHVYVDKDADLKMATEILYNAKTSRPSVCNAAESLLVHRAVAKEFLPMAKASLDRASVEWRGDEATCAILPDIIPATEEDFATEYNDYILSVKVVDSVEDAVAHVNRYGTGHSEAIVTASDEAAEYFMTQVDCAAVYRNASTRFTDGGEFGLGAEIGISTQKLHVRGPFAAEALTTVQYRVLGNGETR